MSIFTLRNPCDWATMGNFNGTRLALSNMVRQSSKIFKDFIRSNDNL